MTKVPSVLQQVHNFIDVVCALTTRPCLLMRHVADAALIERTRTHPCTCTYTTVDFDVQCKPCDRRRGTGAALIRLMPADVFMYIQFRDRIADVRHPEHDDHILLKWLRGTILA